MSSTKKNYVQLDTLLSLPKNVSIFICHSGDTDNVVKSIQRNLGDSVNCPNNILRWSIIDWHKIGHLQKSNCGDCQDLINREIDKADYVIFIIKEKLGHYTLREWFYCLERLNKKRVYLFIDKKTTSDALKYKRIEDILFPAGYIVADSYKNARDIVAFIENEIGKSKIKSVFENIREITSKISLDELKIYDDKINYFLQFMPSLGITRCDGILSPRLERIADKYYKSKQIHNLSEVSKILRLSKSLSINKPCDQLGKLKRQAPMKDIEHEKK